MKQRAPIRLQPDRKHKTTWQHFFTGFRYAFEGVRYAFLTQFNLRFHLAIAGLVCLAAIFLRVTNLEFVILLLVIFGVLVAEMFNTAIEAIVDLASPNYHRLAKIAKDVAAGAVLLQAILAVLVGILVLGPHLWLFLSNFLPFHH